MDIKVKCRTALSVYLMKFRHVVEVDEVHPRVFRDKELLHEHTLFDQCLTAHHQVLHQRGRLEDGVGDAAVHEVLLHA